MSAPRTTVLRRLQWGYVKRSGPCRSLRLLLRGWPQDGRLSTRPTRVSYVKTLLHTFSPTSFLGGDRRSELGLSGGVATRPGGAGRATIAGRCFRASPQFFPNANPLNLLPQATFNGGIQSCQHDRVVRLMNEVRPFYGYATVWDFSGSVTRVVGAHNIKRGLRRARDAARAAARRPLTATFSFNKDGSNPSTRTSDLPTRCWARSRSTRRPTRSRRARRVSEHGVLRAGQLALKRNFTIDAGTRFYYLTPTRDQGDQVAQFEPALSPGGGAPALPRPPPGSHDGP